MARRHHHRKVRRPADPQAPDEDSPFTDFTDTDWGDHGMFVVGFTPGGAPYGADNWDDEHDFVYIAGAGDPPEPPEPTPDDEDDE